MDRIFRLIAGFLSVGTVVLAIAVAYVVGVEQGVNSQQPNIVELFRKLNPDVLIDTLPYMHPLRNALFGSALSIGICWISLFSARFYKQRKCSSERGRNRILPQPTAEDSSIVQSQ